MNKIKLFNHCGVALRVFCVASLILGVTANCTTVFAEIAAASPTSPSSPIAKVEKPTAVAAAKNPKKTDTTKQARKKHAEPLLAMVNGKPVSLQEFNSLYASSLRQRFYHGTVPEGQAEVVRKEITDELVDRKLLLGEAERRGILPDPAKFEQVLAEYDAKYGSEPGWVQKREQFLPDLKLQVAQHSMVEQLEKGIREIPQPTMVEVRTYYDQKPELFTEPESPHLSIIMLKVDPSSSHEVWEKAKEEIQGIYDRIKKGADFAKEARLHSAHDSAANGGDMGYLHGGMLSEGLEEKLNKLQIGEVSEPIRMLEGFSLYRIEDRIPAKLQEFSAVEKRAQGLLERDRISQARVDLLKRLRATAKIKFFAPPTPNKVGKSAQKK